MIRAGDILMVRGTSLFSRGIMAVLSRGDRACEHSHDAIAIERDDGLVQVLTPEPPRLKIETLDVYLHRVTAGGGAWCAVRPSEIYLAELDGDKVACDRIRTKRLWIGHAAKHMVNTPYAARDIWVILKRLAHLDKVLRLVGPDRAHFYCTEACREIWRSNHNIKGVLRWVPPEWENEEMPAPIHTERIAQRGGFFPIAESEAGFFRRICGGGAHVAHPPLVLSPSLAW